MATTVSGLKRSYYDMTGVAPTSHYSESGHNSRVQSPLHTPSRASSQPLDLQASEGPRTSNGLARRVSFQPFASIVLIGVRGVGKSTLGILAASAYSRRLVDADRAFLEATGSAASAYRKTKGTAEYQQRHNQVLESTLNGNSSGAVIVCTFSDLEGNGARILREYAQSHPVVHITRDLEGVQSVLKVWTVERVNDLLSASAPLLRSCSNYEFYNLTDSGNREDTPWTATHAHADVASTPNDSFLTLKRVERDFIRLLRNVIGDHERGQAHHSAYPFSQVEVERRKYTFAVTIKISEILDGSIDFDDAQTGADCVEILVDIAFISKRKYFSDISTAFAIVRRATILPIMISVDSTNAARPYLHGTTLFETMEYCLRLGTDLCTAHLSMTDAQLQHIVGSKGYSRIVAHLQMNTIPPQGWDDPMCIEAYSRSADFGCDIVKITMPAGSVENSGSIESLHKQVQALDKRPRLIAYNTGSRGRTSKCFNKTLTSVKSHASLAVISPNNTSTIDVSAREVTQALFAAFVLEPMRFFIYGGDVSYSLSPAMHNAAYEVCGMRYHYEAISSSKIDGLKTLTQAHDFGGTAITQPYKTTALELMCGLSPHAKVIGAVNTIVPVRELYPDGSIPDEFDIISHRNQQGPVKALYGFNTDWIGIRACIRRGLSPANTIRPQTSALVCGAGGMARSAIYSLISLGVRQIFICNRTLSRATALAQHYNDLISSNQVPEMRPENAPQTNVQVLETFATNWPTDVRTPSIIVCCVPRQTATNEATNFALPEAWLKSPTGGVVLEVAYRQPTSPIAHQIRDRAQAGWIFMDGYDVLPEQAFSQFELFTGRRAPRKLMRDEIKKHMQSQE